MILLQESVKLIMNSMEEREKDKKSFNGILFTTHVDEKHVLAQTTLFQEKVIEIMKPKNGANPINKYGIKKD